MLRRATSPALRVAHATTTALRVTSHGAYASSTRLVPSRSGNGVVIRPNNDTPPPKFKACAVGCVCPP